MAMPLRPADSQLATIIDRLAEFVARNGPEFEKMTKIKQQNNERFSFLQPGELYNDYYQSKVMEERRKIMGTLSPNNNFPQQQQSNIWLTTTGSNGSSHNTVAQANIAAQIEEINSQQMRLREQLIESEKNLNAQHQVLLQQQKNEIEETISKAQMEHIKLCAQENEISLTELDEILQPIIDSCTKDSIANGKASILQQATNSAKRQIISQYILKKAMSPNAVFNQKLHLIYLINDLLHHCVKKNADDLKNCLESVVIPMFCNATMSANEEQKDKLSKLLTLWASKANFFDSCAISKLQSPPSSLQEYHNSLLSQYSAAVTSLTQATKKKFDDYRQQHQTFVEHATKQIAILETQKQALEQQSLNLKQQPIPISSQQQMLSHDLSQNSQPSMIPSILNNVNVNMMLSQNRNDLNLLQNICVNNTSNQNYQSVSHNISMQQQQQFNQQQEQQHQQFVNFNLPPPNLSIPDMSRPPPNFQSIDQGLPIANEPSIEIDLTPKLPFFELPAGLMVPLIRLEDYKYRPIDPAMIQLPMPSSNDKLLAAIEAFYAAPSHERPRDGEGWEKLSLYEYFKVKNSVKKIKEDAIARFEREKSKSPSPIPENLTKPPKKIRKRVYRSESPEKRSKSRSRSKSPEQMKPLVVTSRRKQRSRSPSSPYRSFKRGAGGDSRNERNNRKRSVTPPSFAVTSNKNTEFIDENNKGHQLLKKLGWQSGGLGVSNQGISQPISGGEVRDRNDFYKGIGMSNVNDPYENFRKNRSNNFITRMKSRSEAEKN
ncbi:hypothetical protein PVAND_011308 [Polypedilum vanderplanki]|uniref:Calcium homeostasis endoplasmic reticulum protein n=1 Tax=Polypedilum vanderplanki TaxID=319348 RepID=A0A9J6CJ55_POLVA|nr:hypothetical protein PVAND_011308 [Polypedilum vanderplanki]